MERRPPNLQFPTPDPSLLVPLVSPVPESPLPADPGSERRYRPAWWLPNRHLQTLWGRLIRRLPRVPTRRERWDTPDGDQLDVVRLEGQSADGPRLIILHGLEGTERSHYARGTLAAAAQRGWGADLMLFRSCGGTLNRTRRLYHSGETSDLALVAERVAVEYPRSPLLFAGFSLGGNVLLKWLGERGRALPPQAVAAGAVSVPFDLSRGARHLHHGFARVYEASFVRSLKRKTYGKLTLFPDLVDPATVAGARSIYAFDDGVTAPVHGFADADDYYTRSSALRYLPTIQLPTLLLSAVDDPFLPPAVLG